MHFDPPADLANVTAETLPEDTTVACVAGCYRCVLSYYNQPDHEAIDRREPAIKTPLLRLSRSVTSPARWVPEPIAVSFGTSGNSVEEWRAAISTRGLDAPDFNLSKFSSAENIVVWATIVWRRASASRLSRIATSFAMVGLISLCFPKVIKIGLLLWTSSLAYFAADL